VAGGSMLERGGGGKAPWWLVAACLREAEDGRSLWRLEAAGNRGGWSWEQME
jgi:hypothetical protein